MNTEEIYYFISPTIETRKFYIHEGIESPYDALAMVKIFQRLHLSAEKIEITKKAYEFGESAPKEEIITLEQLEQIASTQTLCLK